ncbi:hypothetical protein DLAC_01751 [Tieghemostelium lacteum]|uniref:MRH domain-containing protein n=1 Tax=Tieghemostelium lacteum TaxID=361077 RepID=A0A152A688_TIELA|nr:hypothetical protein DLAC_01751 [Tieghemostelium lacteum]|eukprot:KYR01742.1 hypothetical protein DLAC_01751 [Tieghemostelium lacteum]
MKIILGVTLILLFFLNNFIVSSQSINTVITQNAGIISITFSGVDFTQNTLGNVFIVGNTSNSGSNSGSKSDCKFISTNNDYFDLTPLRKDGSNYYNSTDSRGFKYYLNLCGTLSSTLTNQVNPPARNIQSLQYAVGDIFITGRSFRNTFTINNINSITLFYDSEIVLGTCQRRVYYNLICDPNVDISIGTVQEDYSNICVYTTTIWSKYACSTKIPGFPLVFQTPTNNIITFNYYLNEFPSSIKIPNYNLSIPLSSIEPIITLFNFDNASRILTISGSFSTLPNSYTFKLGSMDISPTSISTNTIVLDFSTKDGGELTVFYRTTPFNQTYTIPTLTLSFSISVNINDRSMNISTQLPGTFDIKGTAFKDNKLRQVAKNLQFKISYNELNVGGTIFITTSGSNGTTQSPSKIVYPIDEWVSGYSQNQDKLTINFNHNLDNFPITSIYPDTSIISQNSSSITLQLNSNFSMNLIFNKYYNYQLPSLNPIITNFIYSPTDYSILEGIFFIKYLNYLSIDVYTNDSSKPISMSYELVDGKLFIILYYFSDFDVQVSLSFEGSTPSPLISFTAPPPKIYTNNNKNYDNYLTIDCRYCYNLQPKGSAIDPNHFYEYHTIGDISSRVVIHPENVAIGSYYLQSKSGSKSDNFEITGKISMDFTSSFNIQGDLSGFFLVKENYGSQKLQVLAVYDDGNQIELPTTFYKSNDYDYPNVVSFNETVSEIKPLTIQANFNGRLIFKQRYYFAPPIISSVSPIASIKDSEISIYGDSFPSGFISIDFINFQCNDTEVVSPQLLICTADLSQLLPTPPSNISSITLSSDASLSATKENVVTFLPLDKSCPSECNKHGSCNSVLECVCDEGYASYDCSVKIDKKHLGLPTLDKSTILFEGAKDNSFEVLLSHVGEFNDLQYPESVYYIPWVEGLSYKQSTTQYTLGFNTSYIFSNTQNIENQYSVQGIIEGNIFEDPTSRNFYGSELQLMKTSFTIAIDTNSLIAIQNNHMEIIFQITAKGKNELKIQSHDQHILFSKGISYLMMSVSGRSVDLYGNILPTYITPNIFEMNSNIINYDSDSTYIGLQFPSNGSRIALTFSSFVKKEDEKWKIIVGVVVPVVVVASLVGTFIYLYKFKKNSKVVNIKLKTISSSSSSSLNTTTPTITETQTNSTIESQTIEPVNQE